MISVHELTKVLSPTPGELVAVDHLTFSVRAGEVYGLLGPNGAGKTTTVRMILGLSIRRAVMPRSKGCARPNSRRRSNAASASSRRVPGSTSGSRRARCCSSSPTCTDCRRSGPRSGSAIDGSDGSRAVSRSALCHVEHRAAAARATGAGSDSRSAHHAAGRADARAGRLRQPGDLRLHSANCGRKDGR